MSLTFLSTSRIGKIVAISHSKYPIHYTLWEHWSLEGLTTSWLKRDLYRPYFDDFVHHRFWQHPVTSNRLAWHIRVRSLLYRFFMLVPASSDIQLYCIPHSSRVGDTCMIKLITFARDFPFWANHSSIDNLFILCCKQKLYSLAYLCGDRNPVSPIDLQVRCHLMVYVILRKSFRMMYTCRSTSWRRDFSTMTKLVCCRRCCSSMASTVLPNVTCRQCRYFSLRAFPLRSWWWMRQYSRSYNKRIDRTAATLLLASSGDGRLHDNHGRSNEWWEYGIQDSTNQNLV